MVISLQSTSANNIGKNNKHTITNFWISFKGYLDVTILYIDSSGCLSEIAGISDRQIDSLATSRH